MRRTEQPESNDLRAIRPLALMVLFTVALWGCASSGPALPTHSLSERVTAEASPNGWWYARFTLRWSQGEEPSWYLDPLLAHRVVAPVLSQNRNEVLIWRFHRRAARDQAGHQFGFIFYASPETARRVFAELQSDLRLKELKDRGVVVRDIYDNTEVIDRPNIEDTSDRHWPPAIQKSWPYYIQGVSEMWLGLITELAGQAPDAKNPSKLDDLLLLYAQVNTSVEKLWREEGQHAFLHHLNAIFGYEPLVIRQKFLLGF